MMLKKHLDKVEMSPALTKVIDDELGGKLLSEIRQSLCIANVHKLRPCEKIVSMISNKIRRLTIFAKDEFGQEFYDEMVGLDNLWRTLVARVMPQYNFEATLKLGSIIY